jgi:hypothetical protein
MGSIILSMESTMKLTQSERLVLQRQAGTRNVRTDVARHARLFLLLAWQSRSLAF